MEKISYNEYLDALEKVNLFHAQLKEDKSSVEVAIEKSGDGQSDAYIIDLLKKHSTRRVIDAISYFLESETAYRKIPFASAGAVTTCFFVQRYKLAELKKIRNLGTFSLFSLNQILQRAGHALLT